MKTGNINFRDHFLFFILAPLIIIVGVISYYRFMINHDYMVGYEGNCDPVSEKCFIGCEDDECTEEYYYSQIIKYAPDLYKECGGDITDCEAANICLPEDRNCSITYCDPEIDGDDACAISAEESDVESNEGESLEDNEINKNI